jgi:hypothetical protein
MEKMTLNANPEYYDKSLPNPAVQFIYFRSITNKEYLRELKEESSGKTVRVIAWSFQAQGYSGNGRSPLEIIKAR